MQVSVRVKGPVGPTLRQAFGDMTVRTETVITGEVVDDAALHGLLARLRDHGLQVNDLQVSNAPHAGPSERSVGPSDQAWAQ